MAGPSAHSVAICMCVDKFKAQGMSQYLLDDFLGAGAEEVAGRASCRRAAGELARPSASTAGIELDRPGVRCVVFRDPSKCDVTNIINTRAAGGSSSSPPLPRTCLQQLGSLQTGTTYAGVTAARPSPINERCRPACRPVGTWRAAAGYTHTHTHTCCKGPLRLPRGRECHGRRYGPREKHC
jgi:hypothetical protein